MKKVYIETNGCAVLRHETYKIAKAFEANGYAQVNNATDAEAIIFTGCAVIDSTEKFAIDSILRIIREKKANALFVITGCISTIAKQTLSSLKNVILIENDDMYKLDEIFSFDISINEIDFNCFPNRHHSFGDPEIIESSSEKFDEYLSHKIDAIVGNSLAYNQFVYSTRGKHLWREEDLFEIRVAYGCAGNCSYCATKLAIGDFRSVEEDRILRQVKVARNKGFSRIMLMGDEIGHWNDDDKNIVDLIKDINHIAPNIRLGIRYISPDIIVKYYDGLKPFFESGVIYYFCAAFQSASPRILKLMNRNPNVEPFISCMEDMEKNEYDVMRHTQIIVGFPSETLEDVMLTMKALYRSAFDHVTITRYCPRKGTKAFDYPISAENETKEHVELLNMWLEANRYSKLYKTIRKVMVNNSNDIK